MYRQGRKPPKCTTVVRQSIQILFRGAKLVGKHQAKSQAPFWNLDVGFLHFRNREDGICPRQVIA